MRNLLLPFEYLGGVITLSSTADLDYSIQPPSPSFTLTIGIKDHLQAGTAQNLKVDLKWVNRKPAYNPDEYTVTIPEECGGVREHNIYLIELR